MGLLSSKPVDEQSAQDDGNSFPGMLYEFSPQSKGLIPVLRHQIFLSVADTSLKFFDPVSQKSRSFGYGPQLNSRIQSHRKQLHFTVWDAGRSHFLVFAFELMDDVSRFSHQYREKLFAFTLGQQPDQNAKKDQDILNAMKNGEEESDVDEEVDSEEDEEEQQEESAGDLADYDDLGSALSYSSLDDYEPGYTGRFPDEEIVSDQIKAVPTASTLTDESVAKLRTPAKEVSDSSDEEEEAEEEDESEDEEPRKSTIRQGRTYVRAEATAADDITNQLMELSLRDNRAIVLHGDELDVFAPEDDHAHLVSRGTKLQDDAGKSLMPRTSMLHSSSRTMIFMDPKNPSRVYGVDVETGKLIHDFEASETQKPRDFASASKYAQLTARPDFCGFGPSSVFRVDTRTPGIVEDTLKNYIKYENFTAMCTTENGYVAVGNASGEVKLFRELSGKRATSLIQSSGDRITGLDVSANGRYLLATTYGYLMLFDLAVDNDASRTRFTSRAGTSPPHRRLELTGEHRAMWNIPSGFTPSHFNTGDSGETTIVTSAGPFMFTWTLTDALKANGWKKYKMKRLTNHVVEARFLHNQDANVMVATSRDVAVVAQKSCRDPRRIVGPPSKQTAAEAAGVKTYGKWFQD